MPRRGRTHVSAAERIARSSAGDQPVPELIRTLRRNGHRFLPTLYAAWKEAGHSITANMQLEIDDARKRLDTYGSLLASLQSEISGVHAIKGVAIAATYPPGWPRHTNDLDIVVEPQTFWEACVALIDRYQFHPSGMTMLPNGTGFLVSLERSGASPFDWPLRVEVSPVPLIGDAHGLPPRSLVFPFDSLTQLVILLEERFEREFIARDVFDAFTILSKADDHDLGAMWQRLDVTDLWPEFAQLVAALAAAGESSPQPADVASRVARSQRRRRRRSLQAMTDPLIGAARARQRAQVFGRHGWLGVIGKPALAYLSAARARRAGLFAFGAPLTRQRVPLVQIDPQRRHLICRTPIGTWALTFTGELDMHVIESAGGVIPGTRHPAGQLTSENAQPRAERKAP